MVNTRLFKIVLMGLVFMLIYNPVFAEDKGYFSKEAKGWYWHDEYKNPAMNPYTQQAFPIAYGLTSEADLKKRILDIATHFGA